MTDEEIKNYIDTAIERSIRAYRKAGIIKETEEAAYTDASAILANYYAEGQKDKTITYAINGLKFDQYLEIIPLYYGQNLKIERIAEVLGVDVSTVVRNKKRLALEIYKIIT